MPTLRSHMVLEQAKVPPISHCPPIMPCTLRPMCSTEHPRSIITTHVAMEWTIPPVQLLPPTAAPYLLHLVRLMRLQFHNRAPISTIHNRRPVTRIPQQQPVKTLTRSLTKLPTMILKIMMMLTHLILIISANEWIVVTGHPRVGKIFCQIYGVPSWGGSCLIHCLLFCTLHIPCNRSE